MRESDAKEAASWPTSLKSIYWGRKESVVGAHLVTQVRRWLVIVKRCPDHGGWTTIALKQS